MGRLSPSQSAPVGREAGELCAVEALDREGLLVTSEGALVRVLRAEKVILANQKYDRHAYE